MPTGELQELLRREYSETPVGTEAKSAQRWSTWPIWSLLFWVVGSILVGLLDKFSTTDPVARILSAAQ